MYETSREKRDGAVSVEAKKLMSSAARHLRKLPGHVFDFLELARPKTVEEACSLASVISKLSPLVGNMTEFRVVDYLNTVNEFPHLGNWVRQDPDFPDAVFEGSLADDIGFEIKAWFPFSTEITGRFKDSQLRFLEGQVDLVLVAWLPEHVIFGRPRVIDLCIASGRSVAEARDNHYSNPPDYIILEPEDTTDRTKNLQQTNTNGYKWQDSAPSRQEAEDFVSKSNLGSVIYSPRAAYQDQLYALFSRYRYRMDTNYAKIDRIEHSGIEAFKTKVLSTEFHGRAIADWRRILFGRSESSPLEYVLTQDLGIAKD